MYLGVGGPSTPSSNLIQVRSVNLAGRPNTRQATAAAKKKQIAKRLNKAGVKKKGGKKKKKKKGGKKKKKKKTGIVFKKGAVVYHTPLGKTKRSSFSALVKKLPRAVVLRYIKTS